MSRFKLPTKLLNRTMARHPIYASPRPLILQDQKIILSWSAKSGSVQILLWYLTQSSLLETAKAHSPWVHNYRSDVIHSSEAYQRSTRQIAAEGVSDYTLVKFFRDPMERCVSAYRHALRTGYADAPMGQVLGYPIDAKLGYSFHQYLDYLSAIDLRQTDLHHKVQHNEIDEEKFGRKVFIGVDNTFYESLNKLEKEFHLQPTDFSKDREFDDSAESHHATDASARFSSGDLFERKLTKLDADIQWPKTLLSKCEAAYDRVRELYQLDYITLNNSQEYLAEGWNENPKMNCHNGPSRILVKQPPNRLARYLWIKMKNGFDTALVTCNRVPSRSIFLYQRANYLAGRNHLDSAVTWLNKAIAGDPAVAEYHFRLAEIYTQNKRPDDAVAAMMSAIDLEPQNGTLHCELGLLHAENQNYRRALTALNKATDLYPDHGYFYHRTASILNAMGRLEDAIDASTKAVDLNPGRAQFHHLLGNLLLLDKQYGPAFAAHTTAIGIEPSIAAYHISLSRDLGSLGRFDEAIKSAQQALNIEPENSSWQVNLEHLIRQRTVHQGTRQ